MGKMFILDGDVVRLDSKFESVISAGLLCFKKEEPLPLFFDLQSDILGTSQAQIDIKINHELTQGTYEVYSSGYRIDSEFKKIIDKIELPTLSIISIDLDGLLVIEFSDEMVPVKDLTSLTNQNFNIGGKLVSGM